MSRAKRNAEDWRRVVFRARYVTGLDGDTHKVKWELTGLLLYLADFMTAERKVSRGRHLIARDLGVSEASVKRRVTEAHQLGFLSTMQRGQKGITAVYQGVFPDLAPRSAGQLPDPLKTSESDPLNGVSVGQHVDPPRDTHDSPRVVGCDVCGDDGCGECVA